jgi:hypothetical protein
MTTQSKKRLDICRFLCYNTGMKNEKSREEINKATRELMAEAVAIAKRARSK